MRRPRELLRERDAGVQRCASSAGIGPSGLGMSQGGVRWKTKSWPTSGAIDGTIWMALAPVPTTATVLPAEVERVVPPRRVERLALERREARDVRQLRAAERPAARHERRAPGTSARRVVSTVPSARARSSQPGADDACAEPDVRTDAVLVGAVPQVLEDLPLRGEVARPAGPRLERERVEVRLHVAGAARVVVVAPGAADVARLLEDDEVVDSRLLQADGHAQAGEAGSDDDDGAVDHWRTLVHRR